MANSSQIKIVTYTVTAADFANQSFAVPVLWDSPFYDTNYAINCTVVGMPLSFQFGWMAGIFNVTPAGFVAMIDEEGAPIAPVGTVVKIMAIASHK